MKVVKLTEKIGNLDKVVTNKHINAVTEMPPTMSDAYEESVEKDEAIAKDLKDNDALPKDKPFIGASDQPTPKDIEEAKINLEESLFEDVSSRAAIWDDIVNYVYDKLDNALDNISMEVMEAIPDYNADWCRGDFNIVTGNKQLILAKAVADDLMADCDLDESLNEDVPGGKYYLPGIEDASHEEGNIWIDEDPPFDFDSADQNVNLPGYAVEWIAGYLGNGVNNKAREFFRTEEERDSFVDELNRKNAVGIKTWTSPNFYHTLPESLNEDGRQSSLLRKLDDKDIDEEEFDLWTQVYSSLIDNPNEATTKAWGRFKAVLLPKKQRYSVVNADTDGNIVVYGESEDRLEPAKKVADYYKLEYEVKPAREAWATKHPDQRFSLTIKIPEEEVTDIDKYFEK